MINFFYHEIDISLNCGNTDGKNKKKKVVHYLTT